MSGFYRLTRTFNSPHGLTAFVIAVAMCVGCDDRELRGKSLPSPDGETYLVIDDNNGGGCGPIRVDGQDWKFKIHVPGAIAPGVHKIGCGDSATLALEIREGTTFHFDYWGP